MKMQKKKFSAHKLCTGSFFLISYFLLLTSCLLLSGCKSNKAPDVPTQPYGLDEDFYFTGDTIYFNTYTNDPNDDPVYFKFDWGDDEVSEWSSEVESGEEIKMAHVYWDTSTYYVKAMAKDIHNKESEWSTPCTVTVVPKSGAPGTPTFVYAPDSGLIDDEELYFKVTTIDPEGDRVYYQVNWGDGESKWDSVSWASGAPATFYHTYTDTNAGYKVVVRARDVWDAVSEWSDTHTITISYPEPPCFPEETIDSFVIFQNTGYPAYYTQTTLAFKLRKIVNTEWKYQFEWGDGSSSGWIVPQETSPGSGQYNPIESAHEFTEAGSFRVKAWAKDNYEQISEEPALCATEITIQNNFSTEWQEGLSTPRGIEIADNKIWIVDTDNHKVKIFNKSGTLLNTIGTNYLTAPMYIAIDDDYVFVTDWARSKTDDYQVYKFTKSGSFVTKWGGYAVQGEEGKFIEPTGIAVDADYVYVVDAAVPQKRADGRVQKFDKDGNHSLTWWKLDAEASGMTISGDNLYIASQFAHKIQVFTTDGVFVRNIGSEGTEDGKVKGPCDVTVCGDYVYVVDTDNNRIEVFTKTGGSFYVRWGCQGEETGQFKNPEGIRVDQDGHIYVVDTKNNRVQVFQPMSKGAL